jgi:hypothetical protein
MNCAMEASWLDRHCEERSDEAIHLSLRCEMDCFAALAMTVTSIVRPYPNL